MPADRAYGWSVWPFRRAPDLLAQQREQLARDHTRSNAPGEDADDGDRESGMSQAEAEARLRQVFEDFEGFEPPPGVRPIKRWSGSISGSGSNVRIRVTSQTRDETPRETSFSGTPAKLVAFVVRRLLGSAPRRNRP